MQLNWAKVQFPTAETCESFQERNLWPDLSTDKKKKPSWNPSSLRHRWRNAVEFHKVKKKTHYVKRQISRTNPTEWKGSLKKIKWNKKKLGEDKKKKRKDGRGAKVQKFKAKLEINPKKNPADESFRNLIRRNQFNLRGPQANLKESGKHFWIGILQLPENS